MDTPVEEQQMFHYVTRNVAALEHEITDADALSLDTLNHVRFGLAKNSFSNPTLFFGGVT